MSAAELKNRLLIIALRGAAEARRSPFWRLIDAIEFIDATAGNWHGGAQ
jgi:hypothetical protein